MNVLDKGQAELRDLGIDLSEVEAPDHPAAARIHLQPIDEAQRLPRSMYPLSHQTTRLSDWCRVTLLP